MVHFHMTLKSAKKHRRNFMRAVNINTCIQKQMYSLLHVQIYIYIYVYIPCTGLYIHIYIYTYVQDAHVNIHA